MSKFLNTLEPSQHPWDWLCHAGAAFFLIVTGGAQWWAVLLGGIYLEKEQRSQTWYASKTWKEYLLEDAMGDLIADVFGILAGLAIRQLIGNFFVI